MFNAWLFNWQYFNQSQQVALEVVEGEISYNGYVLHETDEITASFSSQWNGPRVEKQIYNIPSYDWLVLTSYLFRERIVIIKWSIKKASAQELIDEMEQMKKLLCQPGKTLQVYIWSEPRQATAHLINPDDLFQREHYNITWQPFTAIFEVVDPFWQEITTNSKTYWALTTTLVEEVLNLGSAKTDPKLTLAFSAASSVTSINFTMWNRSIVITRTINAGDIVIIDCVNKQVTYNAVQIDFDGMFPECDVWNNPYSVTITWTYTVTATMLRKHRFI